MHLRIQEYPMCYVIGIRIPKKQTIKIGNTELDLDPIDIPVQSGFTYESWPVLYKEDIKKCFGIVTTQANPLMAKIHNSKKRMPTILEADTANAWLNENLNSAEIEELAKYQLAESKMSAYTVAKNF